MAKYLIIGDTHIRGINSENRIGSYYEDIMFKIDEIIKLSKEYNVKGVLHGGDLFDSNNVSNLIIDDFIDRVEKVGIIWYILRGNHDEIGHSPELSAGSSLDHIFRRSKFIKHLETIEEEGVTIIGRDYEHEIEEDLLKNGWYTPKNRAKTVKTASKPKDNWKIGIIHAFITERAFLPSVLHIQVKDLNTDFNIIFSSHNHNSFIKIIDEVAFINLGATGRLDINESDIEPSIVLLDTEKRDYKIIKLKSAKSKEEIFDLSKVAIKKQFENEIEKFIESLTTTEFTDLDLLGIVKQICKKSKVDNEVETEVIERITKNETK